MPHFPLLGLKATSSKRGDFLKNLYKIRTLTPDLRCVYAAKLFRVILNLAAGPEHCSGRLRAGGAAGAWLGKRGTASPAPRPDTSAGSKARLPHKAPSSQLMPHEEEMRVYKLQPGVTFWLQSELSRHRTSLLREIRRGILYFKWVWIYTPLQQLFWGQGSFEIL